MILQAALGSGVNPQVGAIFGGTAAPLDPGVNPQVGAIYGGGSAFGAYL